MKHTLPIAAALAACALAMSACQSSNISSSTATTKSSTTASPTTITTQSARDLNPLTGINDVIPGTSVRPVCVMIGNNDRSRPQYGLDKADMYVEGETEGGITRIMAVFSGPSRIPDKLGPVRSARTPFILLAESLGAVYCHAGCSKAGAVTLKAADVSNIDALFYIDGKAFWRDDALRKSKGLEYSLMTSGTNLAAMVQTKKYSTDAKKPSPFSFGSVSAGSGAGSKVQIRMSVNQTIGFTYDAKNRLYDKVNGTLADGEPAKTAEGVQLSATNILILYDERYSENEVTISFRLKSGTGQFITGGTSRPIKWSRTADSLKFTEENGSDLNVNPGKTYICLTASGNASQTVLE